MPSLCGSPGKKAHRTPATVNGGVPPEEHLTSVGGLDTVSRRPVRAFPARTPASFLSYGLFPKVLQ